MPSNSAPRGAQTREQIIQAAHALFLSQGYHATSMRQIASRAGTALGGIYNHFSTKEDIFQTVFIAFHPYNHIIPAVMQAQGASAEEYLRNVAQHVVEGLHRDPGFLNLIFIDLVEFQGRNTVALMEKQIPAFTQILARLVQTAGTRLRPIPPFVIGRSFFGLFFSYYITGVILRTGSNLPAELDDHAFEHFLDVYLHGVLKAPDGKARP